MSQIKSHIKMKTIKKFVNVLFVMFMFTVMNIGCKKTDDSNIPAGITTIDDLQGTWEFQNFYWPGKGNFTSCPPTYGDTQLTLIFNGTTCTMTECGSPVLRLNKAPNWTAELPTNSKQINITDPSDPMNQHAKTFYIKSYSNGTLILNRDFGTGTLGISVTTELTVKLKII
jgi:hypothetical protein